MAIVRDLKAGFEQRRPLAKAAVVVAALTAACGLQWSALSLFAAAPFMLLHGATFFAAWYGGFWPGLACAVAGGFLGNVLFLRPFGEPSLSPQALLATLVFIAVGSIFSLLGESRLRAIARSQAKDRVLRDEAQRKDEFLAMLGHELRNPLASIVTTLELLEKRRSDALELTRIRRNAQHLTHLLDDLLDMSRITSGKVVLKLEVLDLAEPVHAAQEALAAQVSGRGQKLVVTFLEQPVLVRADRVRLTQIATNLLDNASKYTPPGGRLELRCLREGREALLVVRDDGVGMSPELRERAFDLFVQGERTLDRAQGGLGIGLTVVRSLVELHGGRVEAKSAGTGQGSELCVHLPLAVAGEVATPAAAPAEPPQPSAAPAPLRVLLVDDNEDAASVLAEALRLGGHVVEVANDGPSGLELADRFRPQAILLDLGLPLMDGYEVIRRLREKPIHADTRVIALTGYGQDSYRARSLASGFDAHLVKPVELDTVLAALAER